MAERIVIIRERAQAALRAAHKYDYERRGVNWQRVPDSQALRLMIGAGFLTAGEAYVSDGVCTDCGEPVWWDGPGKCLETRDGQRWCFGLQRQRTVMTHWHVLPGMSQYIVPSPEGQPCRCLARSYEHVHQIVRAVGRTDD